MWYVIRVRACQPALSQMKQFTSIRLVATDTPMGPGIHSVV